MSAAWLRARAGFAAFSALSLLALARLLRQDVPGHYRVFTGAARAIWSGQNPYGTDFGTRVGYYFYSPTCAATVFGPLSLLPEKLGLVVFMAASWALFVAGARRFHAAFGEGRPVPQWFWIAIAGQMVGAILASKLEIAIVGILMTALAWLAEPEDDPARSAGAAALLAMILNWKFQPVPVIALALLVWVATRRPARRAAWVPLWLAGALAFSYLLPFGLFERGRLLEYHATWSATFSHFVQEAFLSFENVFAFAHHALGVPVSFAASQAVSAAAGLAFAAWLGAWLWRSRGTQADWRARRGLLLSAALGTTFMTAFSPLGQNNALILYAPLLLSGFVAHESAQGRAKRRQWAWLLGLTWAMMTLAYSDLVPAGARDALRHLSIKPLACLGLGLAVGAGFGQRTNSDG